MAISQEVQVRLSPGICDQSLSKAFCELRYQGSSGLRGEEVQKKDREIRLDKSRKEQYILY